MNDSDNWAQIGEPVARELLGEPNNSLSNPTQLRWGNHGSFSLDRNRGVWFDFESGEGGGVLDLVVKVLNIPRAEALEWLKIKAFLRPSMTAVPRHRPLPARTSSESRRQFLEALPRDIWDRSQPIPMDPHHPARKWFAKRHLWRPEIEAPEALRWFPSLGANCHSGAILALVAPPEHWVTAWPSLPVPDGVQQLNIDSNGVPALDRPQMTGGVQKRSLGTVKDGVFMVGCPHAWSGTTRVAEGVADAVALASRFDGPALAMMSAGAMRAGSVATWLSSMTKVIIYADNDGSAGPVAAQHLRHAVNAQGGNAEARFTAHGKDPADAAAAAGFDQLDERTIGRSISFAARLSEQHGWPLWECQRLAIIHMTGGTR